MNNELELKFVEGTVADKLKPAHVERIERMIGLRFPAIFLDFLKDNNGGVPLKQIFQADGAEKVLETFLCLDSDYKTSEFGDTDIGVTWSRIEDRLNGELMPFAAVYAGDFLCFDYSENEENPKIVLWYAELSEEQRPYLIPVADNFREFLSMLTEEKPGDSEQ